MDKYQHIKNRLILVPQENDGVLKSQMAYTKLLQQVIEMLQACRLAIVVKRIYNQTFLRLNHQLFVKITQENCGALVDLEGLD